MWPVKNSTVGAADAGPLDVHDHLPRPWLGRVDVADRALARPGDDERAHAGLPADPRAAGDGRRGNVHGVPNSRPICREQETWPICAAPSGTADRTGTRTSTGRGCAAALPDSAFTGRPQIAIANTASDLVPCNRHLTEVAEHVAAGVWEAGGVPLDMPVVSLGETQVRPTAMLWRNMAAMAIEEMIRANPIDGVVLLGGCDKTIPALLMGAASVDLPAVVVPGGPDADRHVPRRAARLRDRRVAAERGRPRGQAVPGRTSCQSESSMIRSRGHCNTMGTASTMGLLAEVLGTTLPGTAGLPAPDSRLLAPGARHRRAGRRDGSARPAAQPGAVGRRRSATPSSPWPRSAARPTPSCTCWPSPGGWGYRSAWTTSTASAPTCRCWSTCSRPGST